MEARPLAERPMAGMEWVGARVGASKIGAR